MYKVSTTANMVYQVKWFSKKKGYGFATDPEGKEYFVHHSDIQVGDGFRYLKQGEFVEGSMESMEGDKVKLAQIRAPMENGRLMCQVEKENRDSKRTRREGEGGDEE